jgi:hypothetical protein
MHVFYPTTLKSEEKGSDRVKLARLPIVKADSSVTSFWHDDSNIKCHQIKELSTEIRKV